MFANKLKPQLMVFGILNGIHVCTGAQTLNSFMVE